MTVKYNKGATAAINRCATPENAREWSETEDKLAFCADLLATEDVRSTLWTAEGERNCVRLENKLRKLI